MKLIKDLLEGASGALDYIIIFLVIPAVVIGGGYILEMIASVFRGIF